MKIGIAAPLSLAAVNGGVRTQVTETVRHLRGIGVDVEIIQSDSSHFDFDLVHLFSASTETIGIAKQVKNKGIPLVLSPVFYSNRSGISIANMLKVERFISKIGSGIRSEYGIKSEVCSYADKILPNTGKEKELVQQAFGVDESKLTVIPNGVESRFQHADPDVFINKYGIQDFILFAGQAGAARKNAIQLLQIAPSIEREIVIIGDFYENEYSRECQSMAEKAQNVHLIPTLNHDDPMLESAYAACEIFCLPSLFETPGIAAMEAALTGAKIVITKKGGTKEYFKEYAFYSDPHSNESLKNAIHSAIEAPKSDALKNRILSNYIWDKVAKKTAAVYKDCLN